MKSKFSGLLLFSLVNSVIPMFSTSAQAGVNRVQIINSVIENQISLHLTAHLAAQNLTTSQVIHWLEDVQVNDQGILQELSVGSALRATDAAGTSLEVHCDSILAMTGQGVDAVWALDPRVMNNPNCVTLTGSHPGFSWRFIDMDWFAHSGNVERRTFRPLYDAFEQVLAGVQIFNPSWTRDAWIMRVAADSDLEVQRIWIFASALLDRESPELEKRADCHGEVSRNLVQELNERWIPENGASCRVQYYRFTESCYSERPEDCEWEWLPCEGGSCTAVVAVQTDPGEARARQQQPETP